MSEESSEFQPIFIRFRGRVQGPFGLGQLIALHRRGQFGRAHEISSDRVNWTSAASLERVFQPVIRKSQSVAKADVQAAPTGVDSVRGNSPPPKSAKPVWHYSLGSENYGPVTLLELRGLLANGQLTPTDEVWKEGFDDWIPASEIAELQTKTTGQGGSQELPTRNGGNYCFACGSAVDLRAELCPKCGVRQQPLLAPKSRIVAALLAMFLGTFGIHRFYLGQALLGAAYPGTWILCLGASVLMVVRREFDFATMLLGLSSLPGIVALIEGIVFLCSSDSAFARAHKPK